MAISVEEIIGQAVDRVKETIERTVKEQLIPFAKEFDRKLSEAQALGRSLAAQKSGSEKEVLEAEVLADESTK